MLRSIKQSKTSASFRIWKTIKLTINLIYNFWLLNYWSPLNTRSQSVLAFDQIMNNWEAWQHDHYACADRRVNDYQIWWSLKHLKYVLHCWWIIFRCTFYPKCGVDFHWWRASSEDPPCSWSWCWSAEAKSASDRARSPVRSRLGSQGPTARKRRAGARGRKCWVSPPGSAPWRTSGSSVVRGCWGRYPLNCPSDPEQIIAFRINGFCHWYVQLTYLLLHSLITEVLRWPYISG